MTYRELREKLMEIDETELDGEVLAEVIIETNPGDTLFSADFFDNSVD